MSLAMGAMAFVSPLAAAEKEIQQIFG